MLKAGFTVRFKTGFTVVLFLLNFFAIKLIQYHSKLFTGVVFEILVACTRLLHTPTQYTLNFFFEKSNFNNGKKPTRTTVCCCDNQLGNYLLV